MKDDLIRRQAAVSVVGFAMGDSPSITREDWNAIVEALLGVPSAQPKSYREGYQAGFKDSQPERKKGEWIEREVTHIDDLEAKDIITAWQSCKCSVCGRYDTKPYMYYFNAPKYCSWCGAEMEVSES